MDLPKIETTFSFEETGVDTCKKYDGNFTVLCVLNMARKYQLELEKTKLLADYVVPSAGLSGIATILAHLRVKIVDAPEWWKQSRGGLEILDEEVLVKLYNKIAEKEQEWRDQVKNNGKPSSEGQSDPNSQTESK